MARDLSAVVAGVVLLGVQVSGQSVSRSALHDYRVVHVRGRPRAAVVDRIPARRRHADHRAPGRLRIVRNGKLLPKPVEGVPPVVHRGQGGLLEVAVHPNFATNRLLYITYSKQIGETPIPSSQRRRRRR